MDVNTVPARRSKQGKACPCLVPDSRIGPFKQDGKDCMEVATVRVTRKIDVAAAEERQRWSRAAKAREKNAVMRRAGCLPAGQDKLGARVDQGCRLSCYKIMLRNL